MANDRTGGQILIDQLILHKINVIFMVPGESFLPAIDALYDKKNNIKVIVCRHEASACNMAEAFSKITGKPSICFVTRGPGACHASVGIHTAQQDSTPMILLIGQVPTYLKNKEAFQEVDYIKFFSKPFAKLVMEVNKGSDIPQAFSKIYAKSISGRPGPVVLSLPENTLVNKYNVKNSIIRATNKRKPTISLINKTIKLINQSKYPLIIVGGSCWDRNSYNYLKYFMENNDIPIAVSFRRQDLVDNDNINYIGDLSSSVDPKLVKTVKQADLVLVIGARLGEVTTRGYSTISPTTKKVIIHVYPESNEIGRVYNTNLSIYSNITEFMQILKTIKLSLSSNTIKWRDTARKNYEIYNNPINYNSRLDLGKIILHLKKVMPKDTITTIDAGNFSGWIQRYWRYTEPKCQLAPTSGAMGYGIPAGIAAKIAFPEREVLTFVGDGGFMMAEQEIATAIKYKINPIILLFNNNMFGTIRMHQEKNFPNRVIATNLKNPNFKKLAESYGAYGETILTTKEFPLAIKRAKKSKRISIIELKFDPKQINTSERIKYLKQRRE